MRTIRELISEINFEDKTIQTTPDWESLLYEFRIYDSFWSNDERLKGYYLKVWLCTDTWVGWIAYFLDGEFVYLSTQQARKSDVDIEFVSQESAEKVENYIRSLIKEESELKVSILDLDEQVAPFYKIEYNSQVLHKTALYYDNEVSIINKRKTDGDLHTVKILFSDGNTKDVDCRDLKFPYNTLN